MDKFITMSKPIIKKRERDAALDVLRSFNLVQGKRVKKLEDKFNKLCNTKYAIATNNGTSALHTALHAIGIKPGDEIITTPFTFVATVNSIIMVGAKPVFVDIDGKTYNLDPKKIEKKITNKTRAILAVNLYGQPANYDEINLIAKKYNLIVVEDAAQSINAKYKNNKSGNLADIACFSLYATKNIMCGEGGMLTMNNKKFFESAQLFRQHGQDENKRYEYFGLGYNYRMMDLQATIAIEQLKRLESITRKRQKNAKLYNENLVNIPGIILPHTSPYVSHVFHQYTIRLTQSFASSREKFIHYLKKEGVEVGIYYPMPLHLVPHITKYGYKEGDFPVSELVSKQVLSLPVHPQLSNNDIRYIVDIIKTYQNSYEKI